MATLADEAAAPFSRIIQPMVARQRPGIYACEKNLIGDPVRISALNRSVSGANRRLNPTSSRLAG